MNDETHYAFPHKFQSGPDETTICFGMTLRDYFAAKAMQARLTRSADPLPAPQWFGPGHEVEDARVCYAVADAMLKAREQ